VIVEVGRRTLPHLGALKDGARIVFVAQAVKGRRALLARGEAVRAIMGAWEINDHWLAGQYVIMPDHLHFSVHRRCGDVGKGVDGGLAGVCDEGLAVFNT
jgi:hypothetical protein